MKLEFVNHASLVVESGGVRLISDPWIEGAAFNNGWALLSKTAFGYQDFASITHLWFSHEHPDHFSPPNLKKIPEEIRRKITVLFQRTRDRKVVEFCEKLGFAAVQELTSDTWHTLAPGFEVLCNPWAGFEDSWLCVRTPAAKLLNLNDCWINDRQQLLRIQGQVGKIDVLATQFSVSAWDGNAHEVERLRAGARIMLDKAITQCEVLEPRHVLPFASFIWFCHEENAYMNQAFLGIDEVEAALRTRTRSTPVLMYPGDTWTLGEPHDSSRALARYRADQESLPSRPRVKEETVPREALVEASQKFCRSLMEGSDPSRMKLRWLAQSFRRHRKAGGNGTLGLLKNLASSRIEPARLWVTDHQAGYLFDPEKGLTPASLRREECDVLVGSQSLAFAFKFLWGGQTLAINGRFQEGSADSRRVLFDYFDLAASRNAGRVLSWRTLPQDVARRVEQVISRQP